MRILVTGAGGFLGRALVARLLARQRAAPRNGEPFVVALLDRQLADAPPGDDVELLAGDLTDAELVERATSRPVDCVFHLASVPGGAAERDFELGLAVNLQATIDLLEGLRRRGWKPRFVFASTIAVYGGPLPERVDERTIPVPSSSYGAHKLVGEILVADYSRRGHIDGVAVRLPGIVARPPGPSGLLSAFMSDLVREVAAGRRYTCPVAATGTAWWMSRECAVDNLLQAAVLPADRLERRRSYLLPVVHATMAEVVAALGTVYGVDTEELVDYADDPQLRARFANLPPLECPASVAAGFVADGAVESLVRRALAA